MGRLFILLQLMAMVAIQSHALNESRRVYWGQDIKDLAETRIEFEYELIDEGLTWEEKRIEVQLETIEGAKAYWLILQEGRHRLYWYGSQLGTIFEIRVSGQEALDTNFKFELVGQEVLKPAEENLLYGEIDANSIEGILDWKEREKTQKDLEVFRWQSYPQVLVFAFQDRRVQARYLKRLAFYMEKTHTRGTIQELDKIAHRSGWGAHDYKIEDMVDFFNRAEDKERALGYEIMTGEELWLREFLTSQEIIREKEEEGKTEYTAGELGVRSVVSFVRSDSSSLQRTLLFHELLHTFFFEDASLREKVAGEWDRLSEVNKEIWKSFLHYNGYDASHEYLVINEFFAYALQRPLKDLPWYLPSRILAEAGLQKRAKVDKKAQSSFVEEFISGAEALSAYVYQQYGIKDGDIRYVRSRD